MTNPVSKNNRQPQTAAVAAGGLVRAVVAVVATAVIAAFGAMAAAQERIDPKPQEPSGLKMVAAIEKSLEEVIARTEKSVVAIARVRRESAEDSVPLEFRPDAFGRRIAPANAPLPTDPDFVPTEYGTGVIIDRRGLILTAYHVLGEQSDYFVTTSDRKVYRAKVKAADPRSDLAVLALEAADAASVNLPPISFGDAGTLKKGHLVVTLGNPYAIARDGQASAGWGIVANLSRKAPPAPEESDPAGKRTLHHFGTLIQTDAKLNVGTSGGPLVNLQGEMVGLCVALAATAGHESAAGYAIPVDATFRRALEILKQGREVEYGFLGIQPINLQPPELLAGMQGIRVDRIVAGTPAARYGLKPDDIVTAVDGRPIYDADGLVLEVGRLPVEATAKLNVVRQGQRRTINVSLSKYPVRGRKIVTTPPEAWRGLRVDYTSAFVEADQPRSGLSFADEAVVVTEVEPSTPAAKAGLKRGMLLSQVDGAPVRTPREFQAAVAGKNGPVQLRQVLAERTAVVTVLPGT